MSSAATAQAPVSGTGTLKLTDDERRDLLDRNTETSVDDARAGLGSGSGTGRRIHGEIGTAIGSHGLRSTYGAAAIPLGNSAEAAVSFENSRYGSRR